MQRLIARIATPSASENLSQMKLPTCAHSCVSKTNFPSHHHTHLKTRKDCASSCLHTPTPSLLVSALPPSPKRASISSFVTYLPCTPTRYTRYCVNGSLML